MLYSGSTSSSKRYLQRPSSEHNYIIFCVDQILQVIFSIHIYFWWQNNQFQWDSDHRQQRAAFWFHYSIPFPYIQRSMALSWRCCTLEIGINCGLINDTDTARMWYAVSIWQWAEQQYIYIYLYIYTRMCLIEETGRWEKGFGWYLFHQW